MVAVKQRFGERGKVIAYHGYQSFKGNVLIARRLLGFLAAL